MLSQPQRLYRPIAWNEKTVKKSGCGYFKAITQKPPVQAEGKYDNGAPSRESSLGPHE
jgi:hypothetical protein